MTPAELRDLRIRIGWTQAELADALGLTSRASVSRMESGSRPIMGAVLLLVRALKAEWDGKPLNFTPERFRKS